MNKLTYIDESGISSKIGHSVYVFLYIEFDNYKYISDRVIEIERQLKISHTHWTEMPWKLRLRFAEKIKDLDFEVSAAVYENPILPDAALKYALLEFVRDNDIKNIFIDGKKNKGYEKELRGLFRNKGLSVYIRIIDDKNEPPIRLADFMAGLIRSYISTSNGESIYMFNLLKNKIELHKAKIPD